MMELIDAYEIAIRIKWQLDPYCERVEIAGSIRRNKLEVKDIEIVAKPIIEYGYDLFGNQISWKSKMDDFQFDDLGKIIKNGNKFKQIELHQGIKLDLFIVLPPAQWGVQMIIRTGPAEFSRWVVTQRYKGGALPDNFYVKDGCAYYWNGRGISMDGENEFFNLLGLEYIEPENRKAIWGKYK